MPPTATAMARIHCPRIISPASVGCGQLQHLGPKCRAPTTHGLGVGHFRGAHPGKVVVHQVGAHFPFQSMISLDDGYNPPKAVEQIRRLVEQDDVAFIFQSLGDVTNAVVQKYLNDRKIPQFFNGWRKRASRKAARTAPA